MEPIFLEPVFKQMIWGGSRLKTDFHYDAAGGGTGECWAISANPNGDCRIRNGQYAGMTLSGLWDAHRELFGNVAGDSFPLLVKLIDAKEDLSIQVHPDDVYAREHENGALGKTECWYVLDCVEGGSIIIGHHAKTREEVRYMIENRRWNEWLREIPIRKGDFFQIPSGCVHAIKAGTLILETQQNSDITYRVYDYDRLSNGMPRELHIKQSMDVITAPDNLPEQSAVCEKGNGYEKQIFITCDVYTVSRLTIHGRAVFSQEKPFLNVSVIEGSGTIDGIAIQKGAHFILPAGYGEYTLDGELTLITSSLP